MDKLTGEQYAKATEVNPAMLSGYGTHGKGKDSYPISMNDHHA
jgi:hypothetical protein